MAPNKPVTRRDKDDGKSDTERGIDQRERVERDQMASEGPKADSVPPAEGGGAH
ncbi:hypothetical protein K8R03_03250 [Candidatus Kaiserbacteria bacterium]|nr:hypothetical protein [Candidatus Kaiserbacteria bacterium]